MAVATLPRTWGVEMAVGRHAWTVWGVIAIAYVLVFFQRIAPPMILDRLMGDFAAGAADVGLLTSAYFYGYMVMQLPAGVAVDRWGARRAVLASLVVSGAGTLAFAHATTLPAAGLARAAVAGGDALVFTALIKVAAQWFPPARFGFMAALSQMTGYVGGLLATTPLAFLLGHMEWRSAFTGLGWTIVALLVLAVFLVRDAPAAAAAPRRLRTIAVDAVRGLRRMSTLGTILVWSATFVSFMSLSAVWGVALLMRGYGLSRDEAAVPMLAAMAGYAVGALLIGYLVDRHLATLRRPLFAVTGLRVVLLLVLAPTIGAAMPRAALVACFAVVGFLGGAVSPLATTSVKLSFGTAGLGTAVALHAMMGNLGSALVQPALGAILDARGATAAGYDRLVVWLALISTLAIVGTWFIADKPPRSLVEAPDAHAAPAVAPR